MIRRLVLRWLSQRTRQPFRPSILLSAWKAHVAMLTMLAERIGRLERLRDQAAERKGSRWVSSEDR